MATWTAAAALQARYGRELVDYVNASVDATAVGASLDSVRGGAAAGSSRPRLRLINFALHHFEPRVASAMVADAVSAGAGLLVGDLAPCVGGILWNHILTQSYIPRVLRQQWGGPLGLVSDLPWWAVPLIPLAPLLAWHDATVSTLRAYSTDQIEEFVRAAPGGESYVVEAYGGGRCSDLSDGGHFHWLLRGRAEAAGTFHSFESASFGAWFGLPPALEAALPGMSAPVARFHFVRPSQA